MWENLIKKFTKVIESDLIESGDITELINDNHIEGAINFLNVLISHYKYCELNLGYSLNTAMLRLKTLETLYTRLSTFSEIATFFIEDSTNGREMSREDSKCIQEDIQNIQSILQHNFFSSFIDDLVLSVKINGCDHTFILEPF